jgi:hypothetical protein
VGIGFRARSRTYAFPFASSIGFSGTRDGNASGVLRRANEVFEIVPLEFGCGGSGGGKLITVVGVESCFEGLEIVTQV